MERPAGTRILTRREVADLLTLEDCIPAVAAAFRAHAEGGALPSGVLGLHVPGGAFHVKAAGLAEPALVGVKVNGNFFANEARFALPRIQGVIFLADTRHGYPVAVMDSIEITALRTAAATAVATDHLARKDADVAAIAGCGVQGRVQLRAVAAVRRLSEVFAFDVDPARAAAFAREMSEALAVEVRPTADLHAAASHSAIVVTCTPSTRWVLGRADVAPGAFVAAVGADSEDKQEIEPALLAGAAVVPDILEQSAAFGDLHHAIVAGVMTRHDVRAELGQVVAGLKPGRLADDEIVVFDSTGTALQDVAAAALVYDKAVREARGTMVDFQG